MLSAIIDASRSSGDDGEGLARTIAALVPAIAEGIIRDGWIIGGESGGAEEQIADAAGCEWIGGELSKALPRAVGGSSASWLLLLEAGSVPEPGWWREASQFVSAAALQPDDRGSAATFTLADPRYGFAGRLAEWRAIVRKLMTGRPLPAQGLIVRSALMASQLQTQLARQFPPPVSIRTDILRARILAVPD